MGIALAIGVATFGLVITKATSWPDRPLCAWASRV
jgi:hypothetical protein